MTLFFETVWHDLRSAARSLSSQPRYTTIVLLTLGLAVGGTVAIYSVFKAVLLADLPFANGSRLVTLAEVTPDAPNTPVIDYTFVQELGRRNPLIESAASYTDSLTGLVWSGESEVIRGLRVSFNFFDTLGVRMLYGRTFAREEDQPGRRREVDPQPCLVGAAIRGGPANRGAGRAIRRRGDAGSRGTACNLSPVDQRQLRAGARVLHSARP